MLATTAIMSAAATVLSFPVTACIVAAAIVGIPPICAAFPIGASPVIASRSFKSIEGAVPNSFAILVEASPT